MISGELKSKIDRIWDTMWAGNAPRVIYGEACRLSETTLARLNVTFRQTPYPLKRG